MHVINSSRFKASWTPVGKYTYAELVTMITVNNYIPVASATELDALRTNVSQPMGAGTPFAATFLTGVDKKYVQVNPIDLSIYSNWNYFTNISMTYDGNDLIIDNLTAISGIEASLFGKGIGSSPITLKNIYLTNVNTISGMLLFSDNNVSSTIENCHVSGIINQITTTGSGISSVFYGTVTKCTANITKPTSSTGYCAAIVANNYGNISKCVALGDIDGTQFQGGMTCWNRAGGIISDCYSYVNIIQTGAYGGSFAGANSGTISNCYSIGSVTVGANRGGFCGYNSGTITASYWDTLASGNATSVGGTGKTTAQMKEGVIPDTAIYVGWLASIWDAVDSSNYPILI